MAINQKIIFLVEICNIIINKQENEEIKAVIVYRRVDELGRIVIPKEIRDSQEINIKDPMEIYTDGNTIILRKVEDSCIFCGRTKDISKFNDKTICSKCIESIIAIKQ